MIDSTVIYNSIRQEIMDVKKCQFNLFGISITLTAAILAYAVASKVGPLIYIAPILMNVLCLTIILDKAYNVSEFYGAINVLVSALLALGVLLAIRKWWQLVFGIYTGKAIKDRWSHAIQESNENLS